MQAQRKLHSPFSSSVMLLIQGYKQKRTHYQMISLGKTNNKNSAAITNSCSEQKTRINNKSIQHPLCKSAYVSSLLSSGFFFFSFNRASRISIEHLFLSVTTPCSPCSYCDGHAEVAGRGGNCWLLISNTWRRGELYDRDRASLWGSSHCACPLLTHAPVYSSYRHAPIHSPRHILFSLSLSVTLTNVFFVWKSLLLSASLFLCCGPTSRS